MITALGLLFLLPPAYKLCTYCIFRYHAISVGGIVINLSGGRGLGGRLFVEYKDLQGNSYERKSKAKTHWLFAPQVGEEIRVFYDRRDPRSAIVDRTFHYVFLPLGFMAVGVSMLFYVIRDSLNEIGTSTENHRRSTG